MSIKGFKLSNGSIVRYDYSALDNIVTDDSLSVPGVAADGKAVGDEIAALEARNFDLDESDRLKISGLSGTTSEVTDRIEQVRTALGTEVATRMAADASFEADMVTERNVRAAADSTEKAERVAADSDLLTRINIEKSRIDNIEALPDGSTTADAELINIRIGYDNTEYSSAGNAVRAQISDVRSDLNVVDSLLYSENVVINNSNSDTYTSDSTVRFANLYGFVVGRSYRLEITVNSVSFQAGASSAISSDMSKSTGTALTNLGQVLLRINNTLASPIRNGDVFIKEFTALAGEVNVLMRYKVTTGTLDITVKCYEITNITDDLNDLSNRIDENKNLIINSRMQMGAHRGAEYYAPPNCVSAYEIAGKMGFPWAWLAQIRWSAEKTLYVMHDEDVSITTNGTGNLSELSDSYIETLLCNKLSGYDYSKFTNDELKVPTLEKVIQICLRYGMKMCFRIEPFPNNMDTEDNALIWNNFINLIKAYNITPAEASYSAYNSLSMILCLDLLGDVEICPYEGVTFTAQNYVDWFDERSEYFGNAKKAVLIPATALTLNDVKLLHTNDIRVYAFTNSNTPSQELMENLATWGVDILQNPKFSRIPISD